MHNEHHTEHHQLRTGDMPASDNRAFAVLLTLVAVISIGACVVLSVKLLKRDREIGRLSLALERTDIRFSEEHAELIELRRLYAEQQDALKMPEDEPPVLAAETIILRERVKRLEHELTDCVDCRDSYHAALRELEKLLPRPEVPPDVADPPAPILVPIPEPQGIETHKPAICPCGCGKPLDKCDCCRHEKIRPRKEKRK